MVELSAVEVSGLRLAYRRAGAGEPLVLLHGAFADSREWTAQLAGLSDALDVVAPDFPGCGGSSDPPGPLSLPEYADLLAGFIGALGLDRPHLGGLSLGSMCALALYREHPEVPRSLVLLSAYAGWAGSLPPEEVARRKAWVAEIAGRPVETWGPDFLRSVHGPDAPPAVVDADMAMLRDVRPAFWRASEAFLDADLSDVLGSVAVPTLLLYGELDRRSPPAVARELHARIPGARLVFVPGAGHGVTAEAPAAVNAAIRQFVAGEAGTPAPTR